MRQQPLRYLGDSGSGEKRKIHKELRHPCRQELLLTGHGKDDTRVLKFVPLFLVWVTEYLDSDMLISEIQEEKYILNLGSRE